MTYLYFLTRGVNSKVCFWSTEFIPLLSYKKKSTVIGINATMRGFRAWVRGKIEDTTIDKTRFPKP
jgi:hypothetical protein